VSLYRGDDSGAETAPRWGCLPVAERVWPLGGGRLYRLASAQWWWGAPVRLHWVHGPDTRHRPVYGGLL